MAILKVGFSGSEALEGLRVLRQSATDTTTEIRTLNRALRNLRTPPNLNRGFEVDGIQRQQREIRTLNDLYYQHGIAIGATVRVIKSLKDAYRDLEFAEANVKKTTGFTAHELAKLSDSLRDMANNVTGLTAGFNIDHLYKIAEKAGQLGIQSQKDVLHFTEEISKMVLTSELSAEKASTGFAKLANALKEPITNIDSLLSTVTKLSSETTASEKTLLNYAQRLSGAGKAIGLTTSEIVSLGATLEDVGLSAEVSGTAMSKVMLKLMTNTGDMADAVGLDYRTLADAIKNEPVKALRLFIQKLGDLDKASRLEALEGLKMTGSGVARTLLAMSDNSERLTKNLNIGHEAYRKGTALQKEYLAVSDTLKASEISLDSAFKDLKATLFKEIAPEYRSMIDWTRELIIKGKNHSSTIVKIGEATAVAVIAWKALNLAFSVSPIGRVIGGLSLVASGAITAYKALQKVIGKQEESKKRTENYIKLIKSKAYLEKKREKAIQAVIDKEKIYARSVNRSRDILQGRVKIGEKNKGLTEEQKKGLEANLKKSEKQLKNLRFQVKEYSKIYDLTKKISKEKSTSKYQNLGTSAYIDPLPMDKKSKNKRDRERQGLPALDKMSKQIDTINKKASNTEFKKLPESISKANEGMAKLGKNNRIPLKIEPPKFDQKDLEINFPVGDDTKESYISMLESMDDDMKRLTLNRFDFERIQVEKQAKEYQKLGVEISNITKWKSVKLSFIDYEQEKIKLDKLQKAIDEAEKKRKDSIAKAQVIVKDFNEAYNDIGLSNYELKLKSLNETFAKYREAGVSEAKLQELYLANIKDLASNQVKIEAQKAEEVSKQLKIEREKTSETQKQLLQLGDMAKNFAIGVATDALEAYAQGKSTNEVLRTAGAGARNSMLNSGNPYAMAIGATASLLSGLGTHLIDIKTNIHEGNTGLISSFQELKSVSNRQLDFTKEIARNTANSLDGTRKLALSLQSGNFLTGISDDLAYTLREDSSSRAGGFYSSSRKNKDYGLDFDPQVFSDFMDELQVTKFVLQRISSSSAWGLVSSSRDAIHNLDNVTDNFKNQLQDATFNATEAMMSQAEELGLSTRNVMDSIVVDFGYISTKDKTTKEIQTALNGEIGNILDTAISSMSLGLVESYQDVDETLYETLARVSNEFTQAKDILDRSGFEYIKELRDITNSTDGVYTDTIRSSIKLQEGNEAIRESISGFSGTGDELLSLYQQFQTAQDQLRTIHQSNIELSQSMITLYEGNLNTLIDQQQQLYNDFASTDIKQADRKDLLSSVFGDNIPKTSDEFYELAKAIDTTTDSGAKEMYNLLESMSTFSSYNAEIKKQQEETDRERKARESESRESYSSARDERLKVEKERLDAIAKQREEEQKLRDAQAEKYIEQWKSLRKLRDNESDFYEKAISDFTGAINRIKGSRDGEEGVIQKLIQYNDSRMSLEDAIKTGNTDTIGSKKDDYLKLVSAIDAENNRVIGDGVIRQLEKFKVDFGENEDKSLEKFDKIILGIERVGEELRKFKELKEDELHGVYDELP